MASNNVKTSAKKPNWKPDEEPVESSTDKLIRKSKQDPFIPIGFAGLAAAVGYGIYGYKNRGPMSTSRYIMRLRVVAQSCVVGAILVGVGFAAFRDSQEKKTNK